MLGTSTPLPPKKRLVHQGNRPLFSNMLIKKKILSKDQLGRIKMSHLLQGSFKGAMVNRIKFFFLFANSLYKARFSGLLSQRLSSYFM